MPVAVLQKKIDLLSDIYLEKANEYIELLLLKMQSDKLEKEDARRKRLEKYVGCISNEDAKIMMDAIAECRKV